jgi:MFS family permease
MATTSSAITQPGTRNEGRHLGVALLLLAAAQLMVVLDATIVIVAQPRIQAALGFSGSGLEWVINAYALTFGGLLLLGGRAGDLLGRRRMFVAGLLLFSAASLAGGATRWRLAVPHAPVQLTSAAAVRFKPPLHSRMVPVTKPAAAR